VIKIDCTIEITILIFAYLVVVIMGGYLTAITVIFAAKSIARFNELKDRKMAEHYLIGTLLSITFALLAGIV